MDRLSEMEAFAAVVDQGGFTGAAQKLGISKSAVSKHVSSLETRLGTRLLNRTTRRVDPTDIGLVYYDRARSVLSAALQADAAVQGMQAEPTGTLQILAPSDYGACVLAPLVSEYLALNQGVDVNLVLDHDLAEATRSDIDLSVQLGSRPDNALRSYRLDTVTRILVASPRYLERHGRVARIEDLAQHRLLHQLDTGGDPSWTLTSASGEQRVLRARGRLASNSAACLKDSAMADMGIAFLPDFLVADALESGELLPAMPSLPTQTAPLYIAHAPSQGSLPRVRSFVQFLTEHYRDSQPIEFDRAIA
ncbi:LysR family transcriptional regulator [Mangrovicoccus algicola]|uniref:LysR family transcriptional regulator n=1 Tax=Mangrovicoccus algicola TaxID=2771008 RepID=A0A8J6ZA83_9RHOB|nr:LysR family transcriptional regulator [Mangrovicoccus algicola]MBE3638981.1 LysR family transcriptional regulator [Mangrovicoccus algicola]